MTDLRGRNPYRIQNDGHYVLHISGGRTSGYMLHHLLDAHDGQLPPNAVALFANTGKEREETLVFLDRIAHEWGVPITWVEYTYRSSYPGGRGAATQKNWFRVVGFDTRLYPAADRCGALDLYEAASRDGTPFAELIRSRQMIPNVVRRMCTEDLKVRTVERFARHVLGWKRFRSVLGIRADEPRRVKKALWEECKVLYPLVDASVSEADVLRFWKRHPFDLGLRPDQGNCDLCFLKGVTKLKRLIAEDPARAAWWMDQEEKRRLWSKRPNRTLEKPEMARFIRRYSYSDLLAMPTLPLDAGDDDSVSCFCGD